MSADISAYLQAPSGPLRRLAVSRTLSAPMARISGFLANWALALPLIILAGAMLLVPCLVMVKASFTSAGGALTLANWAGVIGSRSARTAILNSLSLGLTVATISLIIGAPLAWQISRMTRGARSLHLGLMNVATNFSGIGLGFAYIAALGVYGMVTLAMRQMGLPWSPPSANSFWGLVLAYSYGNVPLFVLLSLPAMTLLRDEWWEACQTCSATRVQFWRCVGWPVLRPFLLASWLLIFTWSVGLYGLPVALIGETPAAYPLITIEMSRTMMGSLFGNQRMPVLAVMLMAQAIISLTLYRIMVKRGARWLF